MIESWSVPEESSDALASFDQQDEEASYEALETEQTIRAILRTCVKEEMSAELIRVHIQGYSRALRTIAHMAAASSNDKQICMESAGVIAVMATSERMVNSISSFKLVSKYQFTSEDSE